MVKWGYGVGAVEHYNIFRKNYLIFQKYVCYYEDRKSGNNFLIFLILGQLELTKNTFRNSLKKK